MPDLTNNPIYESLMRVAMGEFEAPEADPAEADPAEAQPLCGCGDPAVIVRNGIALCKNAARMAGISEADYPATPVCPLHGVGCAAWA